MIYRDGLSAKWLHRPKVIKILLFFAVLLITAIIFIAVNRPKRIEDLSGGIFPETFQTRHRPLQRELHQLNREGFFSRSTDRAVPAVFSEWYSAPETRLIIGEKQFVPGEYRFLIKKSLEAGMKEKKIFFKTPLENPVSGDLFRTLLGCFQWYLFRKDWNVCIEMLENMFCYSSLLLSSNAADTYFLSRSMECGKQFEKVFSRNRKALSLWQKTRRTFPEKYLFTMHGIYEMERLRMCHEFEKIRVHGIRLIERKRSGSAIFKEGFLTGSFSQIREGISTSFVDFFYDVDRDQTMTLSMLRQLLYDGVSVSTVDRPDRKMSIQCYRRLVDDSGILSSALHYME